MKGILADNDVTGQFEALLFIFQSDRWQEIWTGLNLSVYTFETLGLVRTVSDAVLWQACQHNEVILVTGNRNYDRPDSLEATIRSGNTPQSLPVFTIADVDRVLESKAYAQQVADRLMEYLFDIDRYRGTGRLYIP